MRIEIVTVTPEKAAELLKKNIGNRPISQKMVDRLVAAMKSGEWKFNGDTIGFCDGVLIDGQHRLSAIIAAEIPIECILVHDVDKGSFATKDTGKKRTIADTLHVMGEVNTARLCHRRLKGALRNPSEICSRGPLRSVVAMTDTIQCNALICIDCKERVSRLSGTQIRCPECRRKADVRAQTEYMDRKRAELAKTLPVVECTKCHEQKPCKSVKLSRKPQCVCLDCLRAMHSRKYQKQVELRVVTIQREAALEASGKKATPLNCYHRAKAGNCTHPSAPWGDCLIQRCKGLCAMGFRA